MKKVATFIRESNHPNADIGVSIQREKLAEYCKSKEYEVTVSETVVGDRKTASPVLLKLLKTAKENGCEKLVMSSTNRVVGTVDDLEEIAKEFAKSGVDLESLDGSHIDGRLKFW